MGSGIARDTMLHNRNGRKVTAYQRQNKGLREEVIRLQKVVAAREQKIADEAQEEIARLSVALLTSDDRLRDVEERLPNVVVEVREIQQRGFFVRLWWALGFARTGRLRYERS